MSTMQSISPCLWFTDQAEEAVNFYLSIFPNSRITQVARYGEAGREVHGRPPGSVMTIAFELDGNAFTALNGGPMFTFNQAVSFQIFCHTQDEIDHYWDKLGKDGPTEAQQCGWLIDKFGLSWQVVPTVLPDLLADADSPAGQRAMLAVMEMKKFDIAALQRAYAG